MLDDGQLLFNDSIEELPDRPVILFNSSNFWIQIDDSAICLTENPQIAFLCWVMCHSVFQLELSKEVRNTLTYFLN